VIALQKRRKRNYWRNQIGRRRRTCKKRGNPRNKSLIELYWCDIWWQGHVHISTVVTWIRSDDLHLIVWINVEYSDVRACRRTNRIVFWGDQGFGVDFVVPVLLTKLWIMKFQPIETINECMTKRWKSISLILQHLMHRLLSGCWSIQFVRENLFN